MALRRALAATAAGIADEFVTSYCSATTSDLDTEIGKLKRTKNRIQAMLSDAEQRRYIEDEVVKLWLRDLKLIAFDADDLLDEYDTHIAISTLPTATGDPSPSGKRKRSSLDSKQMVEVIKDIRRRLDEITKSRNDLRFREGETKRRVRADVPPLHFRSTASFQDNSMVLGRNKERDEIIQLLKSGGQNDVVAISGIGGIGKTTLARIVFSDANVKDYFDSRIWVSSLAGFDVVKITQKIIEAITEKECNVSSLEAMQNRIRQLLDRKKFLLVLDNVWDEVARFWEELLAPLSGGDEGSKILITTRSEAAANKMRTLPIFRLQGLGCEDCLILFKGRAFERGQEECDDLVEIGRKIVQRCQGSPLAAKLLGGLLYNVTDEDQWSSMLNDLPELEAAVNDILPTLKVSYDHLPLHLKQCFAYCSIFPKGYEFDKDELIRLWMAEGLVSCKEIRRLEIVGSKYFDNLLFWSFFQTCDNHMKLKKRYKMPNLVHDLAEYVSNCGCLRIESGSIWPIKSISVRYAFLYHHNMEPVHLEMIPESSNLRTLLLHGEYQMPKKHVLEDLFQNMRCLRVLDLGNSQLQELPDSVGDLKHLRYLSLYNAQLERLPESVCGLYNLQTLELGECYKLVELPRGMSNLVNLRYLGLHVDWDKGTALISMPARIGRLSSLRTLSRFTVVASQTTSNIGELKDLKDLHGELFISKLENVPNEKDAAQANLQDKQFLESLMLQWSKDTHTNIQNGEEDERMFEGLRPHNNLKMLRVEQFDGKEFPSWLGDPTFSSLESLRLTHCRNCKSLPLLGQLPRVNNLSLEGLDELENITSSHLPSMLTTLELRDCQKLASLPPLQSLRDLTVIRGNEEIFKWSCSLTSLSSLTLSKFARLRRVSKNSFQLLTSLKKLKIEGCNKLVALAVQEGLQDLTALESLEIVSCPELSSFADKGLPVSLTELQLHQCKKLTSLPGQLHLLTNLRLLDLRALPALTLMPRQGIPPGLEYLHISKCPLLQKQCQRDVGVNWPEIKHIPYIDID